MAPTGMSAEPMSMQWSHDSGRCDRKNACIKRESPLRIAQPSPCRSAAACGGRSSYQTFSDTNGLQRNSIHVKLKSFVQGHDVVVALPTGSGKVLCF